jgi:predicted GIY-YIG superfamily endonuclease
MPSTYHLYRHFDKAGTLLYIGVTLDPLRRTIAHRTRAHWWAEVATITLERYADRRTALEAEVAAIKAERPTHNVHKNRIAPWPESDPACHAPNGRG